VRCIRWEDGGEAEGELETETTSALLCGVTAPSCDEAELDRGVDLLGVRGALGNTHLM
jgi:hypothetical protein